ncbi:hypothetical protein ACIQZG_14465 [Lysinibacillus sp. NPDC096418]|uniref:hypothetical protein n=1 Tax=Lysinibacillus sp. NPDC096418 TaxID=3364138 RepID=UPI0037FE0D69
MTSYRNETVAFLLASVEVIFDEGLFQWKPQEALQKVEVFITIIETALGTKKGYRRCFLHSYKTLNKWGIERLCSYMPVSNFFDL